MSGTIWLEPVPGPGSKFVFTAFFPPAMEADVQARKSAATTVKAVHALKAGSRILLVEDNAENMILLRAYLENLPLSLDFRSNGFEALVKRREGNYDLVLMDIQMPVMDVTRPLVKSARGRSQRTAASSDCRADRPCLERSFGGEHAGRLRWTPDQAGGARRPGGGHRQIRQGAGPSTEIDSVRDRGVFRPAFLANRTSGSGEDADRSGGS